MSKENVLKEFQQFGERFFIIAILMLLAIFVDVLRFFAFIVLLFALKNIKNVNFELQDKNLKKFRSKIIYSIWMAIIGIAILGIASGIAMYQYMIGVEWIYYLLPLNIAIYGVVLLIKSLWMQKKGWNRLNKFFKENADMFPKDIASYALDGTDKLEKSCKYMVTIILIPIAIIYSLIGMFKLAKLRNIPIHSEEDIYTHKKYVNISPKTQLSESSSGGDYCISCGNKRERKGRFCALCGYDMAPYEAHS
ncbi:MAG: hypothetical protein ACTSR8_06420 [Promethearchaeota archaeon]